MELFKLFQKDGEQHQPPQEQNNADETQEVSQEQREQEKEEEVTLGTKVKIVAALAVVGFAAYVAYWIQEPVDIRADLLGSSTAESQMASSTQEVSISNFAFDPETLTVEKGTMVLWTNKDTVPHNVVSDKFTSPTLNPGESFSYTFHEDGAFAYRCTFHPQMKATVLVGNAAATQAQAATQADILEGFGAGSSLALEETSVSQTMEATTQTPAEETAALSEPLPPVETSAPVEPEQIFTASAPAPADEAALHNAALQSLSESLSTIGTLSSSAQGSVPLSQTSAQAQYEMAAQNGQVQVQTDGKLANSGPEDVLYVAMFGLILYLNRKKLGKLGKSVR